MLAQELERIVGAGNVLWQDCDLMLYEYDSSIDKSRPQAVVFPTSAIQVTDVVKLCTSANVPYIAGGRGRAVRARQVDQAHLLGKGQPTPTIVRGRRHCGNRGSLVDQSQQVLSESAHDTLAHVCHPTQHAGAVQCRAVVAQR